MVLARAISGPLGTCQSLKFVKTATELDWMKMTHGRVSAESATKVLFIARIPMNKQEFIKSLSLEERLILAADIRSEINKLQLILSELGQLNNIQYSGTAFDAEKMKTINDLIMPDLPVGLRK